MAVSEGDILEVSAVHRYLGNNEQVNVFHLQVGEIVSAADADVDADLAELVSAAYAELETLMPTTLDAVEIRWKNLTDDSPTRYVNWGGGYIGGTSGADGLPPGAAALLLWRTGTENVTGRTYLPVFTEAQQSQGGIEALAITAIEAFASALLGPNVGGTSGNTYLLKVWSKVLGQAVLVISTHVQPQIAYMRRRRFGRGS